MILLALSLAGCGKSDAEKATEDHEQCISYGAKPGSDAYIQCRATLHFSRLRKEESDEASAIALAAIASSSASGASAGGRRR